MKGASFNYNERAWAIDVISMINVFCASHNSPIKRAGGESTILHGGGSLFPDVLLYGDGAAGTVIHGWELKMPDTSITDTELYDNALKKAQLMNAKSFLLWNVKEAVFWVQDEEDDQQWQVVESWPSPTIRTRDDVQRNEQEWKDVLRVILEYLSDYFDKKSGLTTNLVDVSSNLYLTTLAAYKSSLADAFKQASAADLYFDVEITQWMEDNKGIEQASDKFTQLAEFVILSWLNRFLFSHYLKTFNAHAALIDTLMLDSSKADVTRTFENITSKCDFMNVFVQTIADQHIDDAFLTHLLQINEILKGFRLEEIGSQYLHQVIDEAMAHSRRKLAGQFSTPYSLAYYLASITITDRTAHVADTCCGSGTIPKAVYNVKRNASLSAENALGTLWASDKFTYPLQLCSIALSDPQAPGHLVHVFHSDVFDLSPGLKAAFMDPFTGTKVVKTIPHMGAVVSNLPFVRFETARILNNIPSDLVGTINNKSDLYAYIILHLGSLVSSVGRVGVIISNSWLATDWGNTFKQELVKHFSIDKIICSAAGRWFENADVVASMLILNRDTETEIPIEFVTTNTPVSEWTGPVLDEMQMATIATGYTSEHISKQAYTLDQIKELELYGISWNALFSDFSWLPQITSKLVPASSLINIARGERRGWDELFYPIDGHGIESDYIRPVLMSSRDLTDSFVGEAVRDAFCCSRSISSLKSMEHTGAYNWIARFKGATNNTGKPLEEVLARNDHHWYEMKPETQADMVISMNPDKKICVYRMRERSFVNQRLIRMTVTKNSLLDILHALLNSALGMLYIESIGFGRGLGALDLSATKISKSLHVLNPDLLTANDKSRIIQSFQRLMDRGVLDLPAELECPFRMEFDKTVLTAFGISVSVQTIYSTLLKIYTIRQTVRD